MTLGAATLHIPFTRTLVRDAAPSHDATNEQEAAQPPPLDEVPPRPVLLPPSLAWMAALAPAA